MELCNSSDAPVTPVGMGGPLNSRKCYAYMYMYLLSLIIDNISVQIVYCSVQCTNSIL